MGGWITPGERPAAGGEPARAAAGAGAAQVDELMAALAADPRRLAALVGEPVAASALALALARAAPAAWYPDAGLVDDPGQAAPALALLLAAAESTATRPDARPVVVLDGPDRVRAMALARELVAHRLHPRLLVRGGRGGFGLRRSVLRGDGIDDSGGG